jgi:Na+-driven multidrug efflux pump
MTQAGFWRGYWPLLLTIAAAQLAQQVDLVILGQFGGGASGAYVALSRVAILELVLMTSMSAVASTAVAQAQRDGDAERVVVGALVVALASGALFGFLGFLFYSRAARLLLNDARVTELVDSGVFWFAAAGPLRFAVNVAVFMLHAFGCGGRVVRWKLIETALRAAMDYLFVAICGAGFPGCFAAAFVVAAVSLVWCWRSFGALSAPSRFASVSLRTFWAGAPNVRAFCSWAFGFLRGTVWEAQRNISAHLAVLTCLALFAAPWIGGFDLSRFNAYSAGQTFMLLAFAPLIALTRFAALRFANVETEARAAAARRLWLQGAPVCALAAALLFRNAEALGALYGQRSDWWTVLVQALALSLPLRYVANVLRAIHQSGGNFAAVATADSATQWLCGVPLVALGLCLDAPRLAYLSLIAPEAICAIWLWRRLSDRARDASLGVAWRVDEFISLGSAALRRIRALRERGLAP